ncbi:hypothetical protein EK904_010024 [Melospiza melodia maxima]|nr:hypothetical protein EK904_010024 [Melospiza melodia maxima]
MILYVQTQKKKKEVEEMKEQLLLETMPVQSNSFPDALCQQAALIRSGPSSLKVSYTHRVYTANEPIHHDCLFPFMSHLLGQTNLIKPAGLFVLWASESRVSAAGTGAHGIDLTNRIDRFSNSANEIDQRPWWQAKTKRIDLKFKLAQPCHHCRNLAIFLVSVTNILLVLVKTHTCEHVHERTNIHTYTHTLLVIYQKKLFPQGKKSDVPELEYKSAKKSFYNSFFHSACCVEYEFNVVHKSLNCASLLQILFRVAVIQRSEGDTIYTPINSSVSLFDNHHSITAPEGVVKVVFEHSIIFHSHKSNSGSNQTFQALLLEIKSARVVTSSFFSSEDIFFRARLLFYCHPLTTPSMIGGWFGRSDFSITAANSGDGNGPAPPDRDVQIVKHCHALENKTAIKNEAIKSRGVFKFLDSPALQILTAAIKSGLGLGGDNCYMGLY